MKLAVCTRYDSLGASSRLRYYDYAPYFREAGLKTSFHPFFNRRYLERLYSGGGKSRFAGCWSTLRRLAAMPWLPKRLLVEYELFPQLPFGIERIFLKNRRYVLNFDDNVWEKYATSPRLADKYDRLCQGAAGIIAANDFLFEKVAKLNANVIKVPTVVDLDRYRTPVARREKFTLVWIGTPVTYGYLEMFADTLRELARDADFELLVIARQKLRERALPGVPMVFEDWSEARETELIGSCHVGIMPLADDAFSRGKSAYKLIQCLAAGLPVIASPVGENRRVVTPECGILADAAAEWRAALEAIRADYAAFSAGAAKRAEDFSLQKYGPATADFLKKSLS